MKICKVMIVSSLVLLVAACGGASKKTAIDETQFSSEMSPEEAYQNAQKALQQQRYKEALPLLEMVVRQPEVNPEQWANLGISLSRTGEYEQAVSVFNKALKGAPGNADILAEKALAYREQGEFDQARETYTQALSKDPKHLMANLNLGILCDLYKEDLDCATRHYQQYLAAFGQEDKNVNIWLKDLAKRKEKLTGSAEQ